MNSVRHRIDSFIVEVFAADLKGLRKRWGDKVIKLFSNGKEVGRAVFALDKAKIPEPYFSNGIIYYFASGGQFESVMKLLDSQSPVFIVWESVRDPKEPGDGDAYFCTDLVKRRGAVPDVPRQG
ncbi:MAG: hypothetical protein JXB23_08250 [Candidatus Aminicenantes bacterium]|nr:hypothetical protein [Candidatus Aminicenantes bacterium]